MPLWRPKTKDAEDGYDGYIDIVINVRDQDSSLKNFLIEVAKRANPGHSFGGKMDEDSDAGEYGFSFDGDGSFSIHSIEVGDVKVWPPKAIEDENSTSFDEGIYKKRDDQRRGK